MPVDQTQRPATRSTTTIDTRELLRELARPRMTGTTGAHEVAEIIRSRFNALGYQVRDFPFTFSTLPGRFGVTAAGALFVLGTLGAAALLNMRHAGVALVVLLTVLVLIGAIAALAPPLTNIIPVGRVNAANLHATKPGKRARYLVVAHLDSKSQPIPLAFRGPAIILAIIAWVAFVVFAVLGLLDPVWIVPRITTLLAVLCFLAGVLLIFCWVENRSPGALDNASGVATLLSVAEREKDKDDVAFLVTDAEELGLVGARAIARTLDPVIGVINVDGVDDNGPFYVLERFGVPPKHIAPHLAAALLSAADAMSFEGQRRTVPFGLLLDHIPLARAGLPAVTLMRGSLKSLRRVHRPADSMDNMHGSGIDDAAAVVSSALDMLRRQPSGPSI